jgi:hypothetical protein
MQFFQSSHNHNMKSMKNSKKFINYGFLLNGVIGLTPILALGLPFLACVGFTPEACHVFPVIFVSFVLMALILVLSLFIASLIMLALTRNVFLLILSISATILIGSIIWFFITMNSSQHDLAIFVVISSYFSYFLLNPILFILYYKKFRKKYAIS